mgnify:CR=1 FL=1
MDVRINRGAEGDADGVDTAEDIEVLDMVVMPAMFLRLRLAVGRMDRHRIQLACIR